MYFKNRAIELRQACGDFLDQHGLKMTMALVFGGYTFDFIGDQYRSPVKVVFYGPEKKSDSEASWSRGCFEIDCCEPIDIDGGWTCWLPNGIAHHEFEGPPERVLEELMGWLTWCDLVPCAKDMPGLINSQRLGWILMRLEDAFPKAKIVASRDEVGEKLEFSARGNRFEILFPRAPEGEEEKAVLRVDDEEVGEFEASNGSGIVEAARAAAKSTKSQLRPR